MGLKDKVVKYKDDADRVKIMSSEKTEGVRFLRTYDDALNNPLSFKDKFTKTVADYTESEYYNRAWAFFNADADGNRILPVEDIYNFYDQILAKTKRSEKYKIKVVGSDKFLINTGNKIVVTNGDFANPSIESVYTGYNNSLQYVWGLLKDYEKQGRYNVRVLENSTDSGIVTVISSGYIRQSNGQRGLYSGSGNGNKNNANANNRSRNVQENNVNPGYISEDINDYVGGTVTLSNGKLYSIWESHGQYYVQVSNIIYRSYK